MTMHSERDIQLDWEPYSFDISSIEFKYDSPNITKIQTAVELQPASLSEFFELIGRTYHSEMYVIGKILQNLGVTRPPAHFENEQEADFLSFGGTEVLLGDTVIDGDLYVGERLLVVGNLAVAGNIWVEETSTSLAVVGSVDAKNVWTAGSVAVEGDFTANYVYGDYNDGQLEIRGTLRAKCVISYDHSIIYDEEAAQIEHRSPRYSSGYFQIFDFDEAEFELFKSVLPEGVAQDDSGEYSVDIDTLFA